MASLTVLAATTRRVCASFAVALMIINVRTNAHAPPSANTLLRPPTAPHMMLQVSDLTMMIGLIILTQTTTKTTTVPLRPNIAEFRHPKSIALRTIRHRQAGMMVSTSSTTLHRGLTSINATKATVQDLLRGHHRGHTAAIIRGTAKGMLAVVIRMVVIAEVVADMLKLERPIALFSRQIVHQPQN